MRRVLLPLICLLSALAGAADRYHLVRVVITGSERYRQEELVRATGLKPDSQVTAEELQGAANRLGNSGAFASVQFAFKPVTGVRAVEADFQVTDAEKFLPAAFENFVWFTESELQEALHQAVPLYNGQLPTSGSLSDDVTAALTRLLAAKRLPSEVNCILAAEIGQLPSVYKFKVVNANVKIKDVSVSGAAHMLPELLAKSLSPLKNTGYLRSDVMKVLEKNLVPLYRQHGYLKFAITEMKPRLEENNLVIIEVSVNEGEQFRLGSYAWSGNRLVSGDELSRRITLKKGEPMNAMQLERDLAQARRLFGKFGREGVTIEPQPSFDGATVSYNFQVNEGELYHMGRVEIEGIDQEQTQKLLQGWKLGEGEPYDNTYLQQYLQHTALKIPGHKWEWMTYEQIDDAGKTVNVRLQVKIE